MTNKFTEFPSGLLDDFDFWITDAKFGRDANYNNGQTVQLFLKGKAFKDEVLVNEEYEERFNLPPGWDSMDDGLTVNHETAENFNRNSGVARLFLRTSEAAPELVDFWVEQGFEPQDSSIWLGCGFHMKEMTDGEGQYKSTKRWPVSYLGSSLSTDNAQAVDSTNGSEAAIMEQLKELAASHDDHETFVNAAIEIPGISGYSNLVKRIADPEDLYAELRA